jgi:hypothetical protein
MKKIITLFLFSASLALAGNINHDLTVKVNPQKHYIEAEDMITIPAAQNTQPLTFLLNSNLKVESGKKGVSIKLLQKNSKASDVGMDQEEYESESDIAVNKYEIVFDKPVKGDITVTLKYKGEIYYPIKQLGEEYARGFSVTPGTIEDRGVYLAGSTYWVPWFNDNLYSFNLTTIMPDGWDVVSQGKRSVHKKKDGKQLTKWESAELMEEVYLIGAQFHEYNYSAGAVQVMAFLRTADEGLANKYLEVTAQYLEMYRKLIGPYPFWKFALVENFWATGYGMPSFTLLGEQIIRFPFILHSSYPHELLHNWWGNSAYVDFKTGNWCEGTTVYMADHLIKEQRGQGDDYRRSTLQKYTDYVNPKNDFPLSKFRSRYNASSEAIGYGKSMMMWDMLREKTGDEAFVKGFQKFYRDYKYKRASFYDIQKSFETVTGQNLTQFFKQWVTRTGAPDIALSDWSVKEKNGVYKLNIRLQQKQKEDVFVLDVPLALFFKNKTEVKKIVMNQREQSYEFTFPEQPLKLEIDPQFHLFRHLNFNEIPPALSKIYGAENITVVLARENNESYKKLAEIWKKDPTKKVTIVYDDEVNKLPQNNAVWILGKNNKLLALVKEGLKDYDAEIGIDKVRFEKTTVPFTNNSILIVTRHPQNPATVMVWLTVANDAAVNGLARKLPHYGKYSYLAFEGDEPANIAKGQWPAVNSPLTAQLSKTEKSSQQLPKRKALATLAPVFSAERMMQHIKYLASDELQGRGLGTPGIEKASQYIAEQFKKIGLEPGGDNGGYFQIWQDVVNKKSDKGDLKNIIGIIPGTNPEMAGQSVVVCAHYDHLGLGWPDVHKGDKGKIHPGADDNASGIAVMLELAQNLAKTMKPQRTVIFIAFSGEENGLRGSKYYLDHTKKYPANKIIGALNLDTVGRLFGNKLLVLNTSSAREWKFIFMGAGYVTGVNAEMVTQDLDASDQRSFIEKGIPAVQFFSGAHRDYHRPGDTADKIDAAGLVKVASFVREGILYLAEREEPLSFQGKAALPKGHPSMKKMGHGVRSVTTGSMPDFGYNGKGVRLADVPKDSPAAKAGLQKGDVIIAMGKTKIKDLRDYASVLKQHKPGDILEVTYKRDDKEKKAKIKLMER